MGRSPPELPHLWLWSPRLLLYQQVTVLSTIIIGSQHDLAAILEIAIDRSRRFEGIEVVDPF